MNIEYLLKNSRLHSFLLTHRLVIFSSGALYFFISLFLYVRYAYRFLRLLDQVCGIATPLHFPPGSAVLLAWPPRVSPTDASFSDAPADFELRAALLHRAATKGEPPPAWALDHEMHGRDWRPGGAGGEGGEGGGGGGSDRRECTLAHALAILQEQYQVKVVVLHDAAEEEERAAAIAAAEAKKAQGDSEEEEEEEQEQEQEQEEGGSKLSHYSEVSSRVWQATGGVRPAPPESVLQPFSLAGSNRCDGDKGTDNNNNNNNGGVVGDGSRSLCSLVTAAEGAPVLQLPPTKAEILAAALKEQQQRGQGGGGGHWESAEFQSIEAELKVARSLRPLALGVVRLPPFAARRVVASVYAALAVDMHRAAARRRRLEKEAGLGGAAAASTSSAAGSFSGNSLSASTGKSSFDVSLEAEARGGFGGDGGRRGGAYGGAFMREGGGEFRDFTVFDLDHQPPPSVVVELAAVPHVARYWREAGGLFASGAGGWPQTKKARRKALVALTATHGSYFGDAIEIGGDRDRSDNDNPVDGVDGGGSGSRSSSSSSSSSSSRSSSSAPPPSSEEVMARQALKYSSTSDGSTHDADRARLLHASWVQASDDGDESSSSDGGGRAGAVESSIRRRKQRRRPRGGSSLEL